MFKTYQVYIIDTDGSERLGCVVFAKSSAHAKLISKSLFGIKLKTISSVVKI